MPRRPFCSDVSAENHEPIAATASQINHWLLVEYRGLWGPNALRASGLSDQVKARLREQVRARERTRLVFVRRPDRRGRPEFVVYVAEASEGAEHVRRLAFESYEDLRHVDLETAGEPLEHPLFLVCTHGKHDPCCARKGRPLFEALAEQLDPEWVWQVTHIGGDRFAGNLVCLPHGLYYGRVAREDAGGVLDEHLAGRVALEHYRGRSSWPFAAQAAERSVREYTGLLGLDDLHLAGFQRNGAEFHVVFEDRRGARHERHVVREFGAEDYLTCNSPAPQRPRRYVVKG
ncbi:MAG TPA: sucrase ferredoxin [Gaiellaceae bacterium]|nr:sucrase ferredoxin [Gaiellaceae bacterium]